LLLTRVAYCCNRATIANVCCSMYQRLKNSLEFRYKQYRYKNLSDGVSAHHYEHQHLLEQGFYSQCGQEKWLLENVFQDKNDGVFVDIGAHDGLTLSNSFYLEQLGWTGLAVEPIPALFEKLQKNRSCICVNGCIAQQNGKRTFRQIEGYAEMLSGLVDEYDAKHLARIEREIAQHGGSYQEIEVDCFAFNSLMKAHGISKIDYLSIDVEGVELEVLKGIDFSQLQISVIGVENNYSDYRIPALLKRHGFAFQAIVGDEIYLNQAI